MKRGEGVDKEGERKAPEVGGGNFPIISEMTRGERDSVRNFNMSHISPM